MNSKSREVILTSFCKAIVYFFFFNFPLFSTRFSWLTQIYTALFKILCFNPKLIYQLEFDIFIGMIEMIRYGWYLNRHEMITFLYQPSYWYKKYQPWYSKESTSFCYTPSNLLSLFVFLSFHYSLLCCYTFFIILSFLYFDTSSLHFILYKFDIIFPIQFIFFLHKNCEYSLSLSTFF